MGLFDLFKKKQPAANASGAGNPVPLTDFRFYYLYGFTDDPNKTASEPALLQGLYQKVIGPVGGIAIRNAYHPYYLINPKGTTVWSAAYVQLYANAGKDAAFKRIADDRAVCLVDLSGLFTQLNVWPDTRLMYAENPLFSQYVPFVIPFLVHGANPTIRWDAEIDKGMKEKGHASDYVSEVTGAIRFFMPSPAFVVGFDEFDENQPSKLIDKFVDFKPYLER